MSSIAGPVKTKLYDNMCHFLSYTKWGLYYDCLYTPQRPFFLGGDNSFIWTSNIPGLNLWYSVIKWPNNLLFKSRHLRMKGIFANIYIRTAINNWGYTSQSSFLSPQWGQARPSLEMPGKEKYSLCLHKNRLSALWNRILFSSLMHLCPAVLVKDMLVHWMEDEDLLDIMIFQSLPLTFTLVYWIRTALKATK